MEAASDDRIKDLVYYSEVQNYCIPHDLGWHFGSLLGVHAMTGLAYRSPTGISIELGELKWRSRSTDSEMYRLGIAVSVVRIYNSKSDRRRCGRALERVDHVVRRGAAG